MSLHALTSTDCAGENDRDEILIGRRSAPRSPVRVPARFRLGEVAVEVVVIDISASGAKLHVPSPPPPGRHGVLTWQGIDCPCRIAWTARDSFGVAFDEPTPALQDLTRKARQAKARPVVAIPLPDMAEPQPWLARQGPARRAVERPAEVRQGGAWIKVVLKNISQHGFSVGWFPRCKEQTQIWLRGPGLPLLDGRVVASNQLVVRCKLRAPLHEAVLNHITGTAR